LIIPTYSQFRANFSLSLADLDVDGLPRWPVIKVREPGSGFGDAGSTLVNIPKPPRNHVPLNVSCNNFLPDSPPFTPDYQWYSSSRTYDTTKKPLTAVPANLRFVSSVGAKLLESVNAGNTWEPMLNPTSPAIAFLDVSSPSTSHRWAVGGSGGIVHSSTSGRSWQTQTSGVTVGLTGVDFQDELSGWAVGEGNTVLRTTNGGALWAPSVTAPHTFTLYSVSFLADGRGIVCGAGGETLYTINNGATWINVTIPTAFGASLLDVDILNTGVGWAVGGQGGVFRTVNAGASYTPQPVGSSYIVGGVSVVTNDIAYIVGESGYIIKTIDGGAVWTELTSGVDAHLTGVRFVSANEGWACGYNTETGSSVVIYTADGGVTWVSQEPLAPGIILAVDSPRVNMGQLSFSGSLTLQINSASAPSDVMTPELVATTFKNCHLYVQRLSDKVIQWADLLRTMVANTE